MLFYLLKIFLANLNKELLQLWRRTRYRVPLYQYDFREHNKLSLGPVARSPVSATGWLRGIKANRFPWYLTLVSANHASSNPGLIDIAS